MIERWATGSCPNLHLLPDVSLLVPHPPVSPLLPLSRCGFLMFCQPVCLCSVGAMGRNYLSTIPRSPTSKLPGQSHCRQFASLVHTLAHVYVLLNLHFLLSWTLRKEMFWGIICCNKEPVIVISYLFWCPWMCHETPQNRSKRFAFIQVVSSQPDSATTSKEENSAPHAPAPGSFKPFS